MLHAIFSYTAGRFQGSWSPAVLTARAHGQVRALPGIGHTIEAQLTALGLATAADLRALPRAALAARFGLRLGGFLYDACRGEDASAVVATGPPKAITVEDSFKSCTTAAAAEHVLRVLAPDLARAPGGPGPPLRCPLSVWHLSSANF